ncbi:MAG: hypothetical protein KBG07_04135 [Elusimicrobia bacterium]|nr:hypothetical protein [Elusimicrobiota bacterium]
MSLEDENRNKNQIIDEKLRSFGLVDSELLASFDEAYNYAAASTMNWLIAKLKILKEVVGHGKTIGIESSRRISDVKELNAWVCERYPDIAERI